jgi:hypothetical protein
MVRLIAPQFVKPYVKSQKNDANDAEAICEAVRGPSMRFVPAKKIEQQDLQCLHRVRSRLIGCRTQLVNQIRGLLAEYGLFFRSMLLSCAAISPRCWKTTGTNSRFPPGIYSTPSRKNWSNWKPRSVPRISGSSGHSGRTKNASVLAPWKGSDP